MMVYMEKKRGGAECRGIRRVTQGNQEPRIWEFCSSGNGEEKGVGIKKRSENAPSFEPQHTTVAGGALYAFLFGYLGLRAQS